MEDPLSQIACEKEAVWPLASQCGEKTELGDTDVLRLIHNGEVKRRILAISELLSEQAEHAGSGHQTQVSKFGLDPFEDGPDQSLERFATGRRVLRPSRLTSR